MAEPRAQVITSAGAGSAAAIAINADLVQRHSRRTLPTNRSGDRVRPRGEDGGLDDLDALAGERRVVGDAHPFFEPGGGPDRTRGGDALGVHELSEGPRSQLTPGLPLCPQ